MAYIGNTATTQAFTPAIDYFSGNGSTTAFTLSRTVASTAQVQAVIENVPQNPGSAFTVSGNTITFTSAPPSGTNNIYVYYVSLISQVDALPQSPQVFGSMTFSSSGARIYGDYTNATVTNRLSFQTTTANSSTGIYALPSGTSTAASWQATNNSDPTNASKVLIATNGSTDVQLVSGRNGTGTYLPLTFYTNGSEQMRLDTAGNLGLGVTPSAWNSAIVGFQLGNYGSVFAFKNSGNVYLNNNSYTNSVGNEIYINTAPAGRYRINDNVHVWYNAPSGTAGSAITFTQAMTLDASGNLLVGTTTSLANGMTVSGGNGPQFALNTTTQFTQLNFCNSGTQKGFVAFDNTNTRLIIQNASAGVYLASGATSWTSNSDERKKDIIEPITNATQKLSGLRTVIGKYKTDKDGVRRSFLIAQDVQAAFPEAVDASNPDDLGVMYSDLVPVLVKAIQEQQALIQSLTARIEALEGK